MYTNINARTNVNNITNMIIDNNNHIHIRINTCANTNINNNIISLHSGFTVCQPLGPALERCCSPGARAPVPGCPLA